MKYPWGVQNRGSHERESVRILRRRKGREWASERRQDRWEGTFVRTLGVCQGPMNGPTLEVSSSRPKGLWEVGTLVLRMWFSGGTSILNPRFWDPNFVTFWGILLIARGKRFFEFVKNRRFRFFKYFRIKESWIPVVSQASNQLFDWFFDFKKIWQLCLYAKTG